MKNIYKKIAATAAASLMVAAVSAQGVTSYYMPNAVERTEHNASFAPARGYFNIPVVGAMSLGVSGNIAVSDFIVPNPDGTLTTIFNTSVSAADAMSGLKDTNITGLKNRFSILGFGRYCKDHKSFWSFDIGLVSSLNFSIPSEMVQFLKEDQDQITIKDMNMYMESYGEVAFGYSRPINDKINVGGRAKVLVGLANAKFNIDRMDITRNSSEWVADATGTFDLNASGITAETSLTSDGVEQYELGDISGTPDGPAGYGFALDLGATYDFDDRLQFSLGVNDLGMMIWSADANTSASVANSFKFTGTTYDANTGESSGTDGIEFGDIVLEAEESEATKNWLQSSITAGADYDFFHHRISGGLVYQADFWKSKTIHNLTAIATYTPINWFSIAASYAVTNNHGNSVGLAANLATGFVNLYVASDFLLSKKSAQYIPLNQSSMNFSFGLAVPFGKKGERHL